MDKVCCLVESEVDRRYSLIVGVSRDEELIDKLKDILEANEANAYRAYEKQWAEYAEMPEVTDRGKEVLPLTKDEEYAAALKTRNAGGLY